MLKKRMSKAQEKRENANKKRAIKDPVAATREYEVSGMAGEHVLARLFQLLPLRKNYKGEE